MEKIFNIAFLVTIIGLISSRLLYVILYFKIIFLNPLAFLLFPYFPGLSLSGGILGGSLALVFLLRGKKYPEARLFDFFTFAFSIALLVGETIVYILSFLHTKQFSLVMLLELGLGICLFLTMLFVFKKQAIKEGSAGLILVMGISCLSIVSVLLQKHQEMSAFYKEIGA